MELVLTGAQIEVLLVHLHVMRKSIKTVLKRNYGVFEGKRLLKVYDKIKDALEAENGLLTKEEEYHFSFDYEQIDMLYSFLGEFVKRVQEEIKSKVYLEHEQEQVKENMNLNLLLEVQNKVNILYKEGEKIG